jgi:tripartite-type tricarboxylate transporter receptor subunit TctC
MHWRQSWFIRVAQMLSVAVAPGLLQAAPSPVPTYQDWYSNPDRFVLPAQLPWTLEPRAFTVRDSSGFEEVFAFRLGTDISRQPLSQALRLSLNPLDPRSALLPSLFNTETGEVQTLTDPAARRFCDGQWTVERLESIGLNPEEEPTLKIWLQWHRPDGTTRQQIGFGRLDGAGRWVQLPLEHYMFHNREPYSKDRVDCDGKRIASDTPASPSPSPLTLLGAAGGQGQAPSPLRMAERFGQIGLLDARGRWVTPRPIADVTTSQWLFRRRNRFISNGVGLIDGGGRMTVPAVFGDLPPVTADSRIRLCTPFYAEKHAPTDPLRCAWQKLRPRANPDLHPVRGGAEVNGLWGYQDARGDWVITPRYRSAKAFRHGYSVVEDDLPSAWRPPGWPESRPILTSIQRVGRYWVAKVVADQRGKAATAIGLMNDGGQWLRPVVRSSWHLVVPFAPGGKSDFWAQALARRLPGVLGREVEVEHIPQATTEDYARLAKGWWGPNRYLLATVRLPRGGIASEHGSAPMVTELRRLVPVTTVAAEPMVLLIKPARADALGITDARSLIDYARTHPGVLRVGTGEDGSTGHLAAELFDAMAQVDIRRVAFAGMAPSAATITAADVDLVMAPLSLWRREILMERMRILGTTAAKGHPQVVSTIWNNNSTYRLDRLVQHPERADAQTLSLLTQGSGTAEFQWLLPLLADEPGLAEYQAYDYYSVWAAQNSPPEPVRTLQKGIAEVLSTPEMQALLTQENAVVGGLSSTALEELEAEEADRWNQVVGKEQKRHE